MLRLALTVLSCALLAAPPARADVLVVSSDGPFFAPQAAIDVAVDGDTVLVEGPFTFGGFTLDGKGLEVIADGGTVDLVGPIVVRNIGAGQRVLVSGFRSQGLYHDTDGLVRMGLYVDDASGPVRFADCSFQGADSQAVVDGGTITGEPRGSHGAWVASSSANLAFVRCSFEGGRAVSTASSDGAFPCLCLPGYEGGHGLLAVNSIVSLYDCSATGGRGGDADIFAGPGGDGVHGIIGSIFTSGGAYTGGDGGTGTDFVIAEGGDGGAGFRGSASTTSFHLDNLTEGGAGGVAITGPAGDDGPDRLTLGPTFDFPGTARSLVMTSPVREGDLSDITISGEPGDLAFVLISLVDNHQLMPQFQGPLLTGTPLLLFEFLGVLPGSGEIAGSLLMPELGPGFEALSLRLQGLLSPDGVSGVLSSWSPLVIIDSGF